MINKKVAAFSLALLTACTAPKVLSAAEKAILQDRLAPAEAVSFDVYLPFQHRDQLEKDLQSLHDPFSPSYRKWLTPPEFTARYGASDAQLSSIEKELSSFGLQTSRVTAQRLHVTGNASAVEQALGTVLQRGTYPSGKPAIAAAQPMRKPGSIAAANAVVTGLSGSIRMRAHSRPIAVPQNRYSPTGGYFFDDLKQAYSFPSYKAYSGKGVTIGILGSGDFNPADMAEYFGYEKLAVPSFKTINVDGGAPYDPVYSGETHLDLQQSGGMAPDAKVLLYNIPDLSDQSILDGLSKIISDNKTDVVSMSFGGPEIFYTAAYAPIFGETEGVLQVEDDLMAEGNAFGITFIASSGDAGALSAVPPGCFNYGPNCGAAVASAEFPASSPHVTAVGGTNLVTTHKRGSLDSKYLFEEAYPDPLLGDIFFGTSATGQYFGSGGGDSILFRKPLFQLGANTGNRRFRTVPDVSLHMGGCPGGAVQPCNPDDSFDYEVIGGKFYGVVGTSASAPDFAGLTALNIQRQGTRLGNENYYIYLLAGLQNAGLPINAFKTDIPGFNGLYYTTPTGYNRVLGNGTLNGVNFLLAPFTPVAGTPQSPSNP